MLIERMESAVITFQFCKELNLNSGMEKKCSSNKCGVPRAKVRKDNGDGDGERGKGQAASGKRQAPR